MRTVSLENRYVAFAVATGGVISGQVYATEADGVWVTVSDDVAIQGSPDNVKQPIFFFPFCQMFWMVTSRQGQR